MKRYWTILLKTLTEPTLPTCQRFWFWAFLLLILSSAGFLIASSLGESITFYYTPTEIIEKGSDGNRSLRIGGLVKPGSLQYIPPNKIHFLLTDGVHEIPVSYQGPLPTLFQEGQGAVVQGMFQQDLFRGTEVLAKHDEKYTPLKMKGIQK